MQNFSKSHEAMGDEDSRAPTRMFGQEGLCSPPCPCLSPLPVLVTSSSIFTICREAVKFESFFTCFSPRPQLIEARRAGRSAQAIFTRKRGC